MQVEIEGRSYTLSEVLELFNRLSRAGRCGALSAEGIECERIALLKQGAEGAPRCLEHAWVRQTVH